jgi:hypothetical protein
LAILQSPQPQPIESVLIALLNEITTIPDNFILVLDNHHVIGFKLGDIIPEGKEGIMYNVIWMGSSPSRQ